MTLSFPVDDEGIGPNWDDLGNVDSVRARGWEVEEVAVVRLGEGRYRLAEKRAGPFSGMRLEWGDEFVAVGAGSLGAAGHPEWVKHVPSDSFTARVRPDGVARGINLWMLQVVMPRAFRHYGWLLRGPLSKEEPLAVLVHRHGGGWENCAGGLLRISVSADVARRFEDEALRDLGIRLAD